MFDSGCDRATGHEGGVHDDAEAFDLEIGFIQGFKGVTIIKVMVKRHSKMRISDGSDECGVVSRGGEQAEAMTVDRNIHGQDRGNFYSRWRQSMGRR